MESNQVTALAFFFDDIRLEIGNKLSLIGQYTLEMSFAEIALPVDRISVLLHVRWPRSHDIGKCLARVDIPGQPKADYQELPFQAAFDLDSDKSAFSVNIMQAILNLRFPPLRSGDAIDVWFMADDREYAAGRLRIKGPQAVVSS